MNIDHFSYWSKSETESISTCGACGHGDLAAKYRDLKDLEEGIPGNWGMDECMKCHSLLLNPRPTAIAIAKAYRSYYTHEPQTLENSVLTDSSIPAKIARGYLSRRYNIPSKGDEYSAMITRILLPLKQQLDYFMRNLPKQPGHLLDVGCGNGGFLQRASSAGWKVTGVDPDPKAAHAARIETSSSIYPSIEDVKGAPFDVITLSHVIEHLHAPREMLKHCFSLLRPNGMIWIATPNIMGMGHRIYGNNWQALEIPRHIIMPSPLALLSMLKVSGFHSIRFHRRGRGSAKRFEANRTRSPSAINGNLQAKLLATKTDLLSSLFAFSGEDLVVSALRPK